MHKKDIMTDEVWSYTAKMAAGTDYAETFSFCSCECLIAWLIDDEKVLKLKLRRMKVDRAIRHPHSIALAPTKVEGDARFDDVKYLLEGDEFVKKETVEVLDFEHMSRDEMEKEFDKEEMESLDSAYAE